MYSQVFCYYLLRKSRKRLSPLFLSVLALTTGLVDHVLNLWAAPMSPVIGCSGHILARHLNSPGRETKTGVGPLNYLRWSDGGYCGFFVVVFITFASAAASFFLFTSSSDQSYQQEARFTHAVFGARSGSKNNDKYKSFLYILPLIIHYCLWLKTTAPKMQM